MGRNYNGAIEGKFWTGIQQSDDISTICNTDYEKMYVYSPCSCVRYDEHDYCRVCYNSKENNLCELNNSTSMYEFTESDALYEDAPFIRYYLYSNQHKQETINCIEDIKNKIDTNSFTIDIDNIDSYKYTTNFKESSDLEYNRLVARYCLALQILKAFEYADTLVIDCEY